MKIKSLLLSCMVSLGFASAGFAAEIQNEQAPLSRKQWALGILPAVTYEPWDGKDRLDVNSLPLIVEYALTEHVSLRGRSIANFRWEDQHSVGFSNLGLGFSLPVYWGQKKASHWYDLFYLGPILEGNLDITDQSTTLTLGAELGYLFLFSEHLALNVGFQGGASFIQGFADNPVWPHQGIMVTLNMIFDL